MFKPHKLDVNHDTYHSVGGIDSRISTVKQSPLSLHYGNEHTHKSNVSLSSGSVVRGKDSRL
jgi:hypothetical protein